MKTARLLVLLLIVLASASAFAQSPVIVAQVTLLNQSRPIPSTVLLTPTTNGVYRVSAYMTGLFTEKPAGSYSLELVWFDESGFAQQFLLASLNPATGLPYGQGSFLIRADAGQPIEYSLSGPHITNFGYNLFITVEQLETD